MHLTFEQIKPITQGFDHYFKNLWNAIKDKI